MYKGQKIAVFYHLYTANNWRELFAEQLVRMEASGLYAAADYIHFGVNEVDPIPNDIPGIKISKNVNLKGEADTLLSLWQFCQRNRDYKILYFHCKGVSQFAMVDGQWRQINEFFITEWRHYLEYVVIDHWQHCVNRLDSYDCASTDWYTPEICSIIGYGCTPHYSGNFWWANSSYLAGLDPRMLYTDNKNDVEFWIGSQQPNYYSFWFSNRTLYYHKLYEEEYKSIPIVD